MATVWTFSLAFDLMGITNKTFEAWHVKPGTILTIDV